MSTCSGLLWVDRKGLYPAIHVSYPFKCVLCHLLQQKQKLIFSYGQLAKLLRCPLIPENDCWENAGKKFLFAPTELKCGLCVCTHTYTYTVMFVCLVL